MTDRSERPWEPDLAHDEGYALFPKERRVVADDGTPIAYTMRNVDGDQIPVLFANGWSCSDAYWGDLLPALEARGHPCLLPDTRGHGRSGLPRDPGRGARNLTIDDVSMPRIARDLIAVLDDAGIEQVLIMGHSMGCQTALEVYRQIPERVLGLVLVAGTFENPTTTLYRTSLGDRAFPVLSSIVRWAPELLTPLWTTIGPARVGHALARAARAAGPKATPAKLHPYLRHLRSVDPSVLVLMAGAMRAHTAADLLGDITAPALVVAAGADVFTPARCSEVMHHRIPHSEIVTFPLAGHTLPIEEPEALAAAIDAFVARRVTPLHRAARQHPAPANAPAPAPASGPRTRRSAGQPARRRDIERRDSKKSTNT